MFELRAAAALPLPSFTISNHSNSLRIANFEFSKPQNFPDRMTRTSDSKAIMP